MPKISHIHASSIEDSSGKPALRVSVLTDDNCEGIYEVPSGASTGAHEALELRDKDSTLLSAIDVIENAIAPAIIGFDAMDQRGIDSALLVMDGSEDKSILGGNAMIGVSTAVARAASMSSGVMTFEYLRSLADISPSRKVPYLFVNLIEGGKHASSGSPFQEHIIIPDTDDALRAYQIAYVIKSSLEEVLVDTFSESGFSRGDEGGFVFSVDGVEEAFVVLRDAIVRAGIDEDVHIGADFAASSFYSGVGYDLDTKTVQTAELLDIYRGLIRDIPLWSLEDPFYEEDFDSFSILLGAEPKAVIVGDDLTVTNKKRIERAVESKSINAVIIKPNQIGTITETLDAMRYARESGIHLIASHRGEETMDDFIADLAYAFGCFGLKAGAVGAPERDAKYKRLIDISNME